ncbi:glutamate receptor ionotropic, delta-1-like [Diorhabda sublineata]|uniref:glutamate receptor ionotropic, delta-1-like n=1 Tax=Diorhabda sublineata TaxID=1163346 RepID=UPI0024E10A98|nr:glutamate receptor ionotropic, delta-1-like [Diorhabda sublineata]
MSKGKDQQYKDYDVVMNMAYVKFRESCTKDNGFNVKLVKENLDIFLNKNIYSSIHSSLKYSEKALNQTEYKTAIVTYLGTNVSYDQMLQKVNKLDQFKRKAAWLIISSCCVQTDVINYLRQGSFGLDIDIVVAFVPHFHQKNNNFNYTSWKSLFTEEEAFLPFDRNSNRSIDYCFDLNDNRSKTNHESYSLYQIYKIKRNTNTSLVMHPLGLWNMASSTKKLVPFWNYEKRRNFYKFPIIFGAVDKHLDGTVQESELDPTTTHFANYFSEFLNSSKIFLAYNKIGREENGEWTDLLAAITDEEIDLSVEGVAITLEKYSAMSFSSTILKNTKNVYIEPAKSEEIRNIFLVPFGSRMMFCVIATGFILSVTITINNFVDSRFCSKDIQIKNRNLADSMVWCIGIFSQQGSIWKPNSNSQKVIVLISLVLSLIIYNSYSAFITSVLSVELSSIRSVTDLLKSDYTIGYTKGSEDEEYLRSANNSELKQIYLRGYLQTDSHNISEGIIKVIQSNYGLFASGQAARIELWNMSKCKCKFDIDEINIHYTVQYYGIVMPKRSPYKKLINLSLIKMYETGIYKYIYSIIYPELQKCVKTKTYQSARLVDLSTAFFFLGFVWCASFLIMIAENLWNQKRLIYHNLRRRFNSGIGVNLP